MSTNYIRSSYSKPSVFLKAQAAFTKDSMNSWTCMFPKLNFQSWKPSNDPTSSYLHQHYIDLHQHYIDFAVFKREKILKSLTFAILMLTLKSVGKQPYSYSYDTSSATFFDSAINLFDLCLELHLQPAHVLLVFHHFLF